MCTITRKQTTRSTTSLLPVSQSFTGTDPNRNFCFAALAIHCFKCTSPTSWSHCDLLVNQEANRDCPAEKIRCIAVMERKNPRERVEYRKDCANRLENPCHEKRVEDCRSTLCDGDLCNFALTPSATLIASGFRCFRCISTKSWDDCVEKAEEIICDTGYRKCYKLEFKRENGVTEYIKDCTVPLACGNSSINMPQAERRNIKCCGQHLCNEASIKSSPVAIFGPLLLVIVVFLFDAQNNL